MGYSPAISSYITKLIQKNKKTKEHSVFETRFNIPQAKYKQSYLGLKKKKAKSTTMGAQDFIFKPNFPTSLTFETLDTLELHPAFLVKGQKLWDPLDVKGNSFGNPSMWKLWDPLDVKGAFT